MAWDRQVAYHQAYNMACTVEDPEAQYPEGELVPLEPLGLLEATSNWAHQHPLKALIVAAVAAAAAASAARTTEGHLSSAAMGPSHSTHISTPQYPD